MRIANPTRAAYRTLHGQDAPPEMQPWQIAKDVLENWDLRVLDEHTAKQALFEIILHSVYPSEALTKEIVGEGEEKILELFPESGFQDGHIHMDDVADLERKYWTEQEQSQEFKNNIR